MLAIPGCGVPNNDPDNRLQELSDSFQSLEFVKTYNSMEGYSAKSTVKDNTFTVELKSDQDYTFNYKLDGSVLSYDGTMDFTALYISVYVAVAKAKLDGYDESKASQALSDNSVKELTLENDGLYINETDFKIDLDKKMNLPDLSDVYIKVGDIEIEEGYTSYVGHVGEISYAINLGSEYSNTSVIIAEPEKLTERAYKSILSVVEAIEGKEKADAFKANWTELKDAAFGDYIIVLNPEVDENDDHSDYYEQFYGDGNKIVALTIKTMIDE
jgi:hypothetical protein